MAKNTSPLEQRAQERMIQHMQKQNARMIARMEERNEERLKEVWIDRLVDALKNNEDVSSYASTIEQHGYDFDNCLKNAVQQYNKELKQERKANRKKFFLEMLKNKISQELQYKVDDLDFVKIKKEFGYTEEEVRKMFKETAKEIFADIFKSECKLDEPCEENLKTLYMLGTHLERTKESINKEIAVHRLNRFEKKYTEEHRKTAWLIIAVLSILEIVFIKWWSIMTIPVTLLSVNYIYKIIARVIFRLKT